MDLPHEDYNIEFESVNVIFTFSYNSWNYCDLWATWLNYYIV